MVRALAEASVLAALPRAASAAAAAARSAAARSAAATAARARSVGDWSVEISLGEVGGAIDETPLAERG
eukprot:scaffold27107_cov39-Phaeocystis_antarctica.AAC.1